MPEQYACVSLLGLLQPVLAQDAWPTAVTRTRMLMP